MYKSKRTRYQKLPTRAERGFDRTSHPDRPVRKRCATRDTFPYFRLLQAHHAQFHRNDQADYTVIDRGITAAYIPSADETRDLPANKHNELSKLVSRRRCQTPHCAG